MAENTINTLQIEIESSSSHAEEGINRLAEALMKLQKKMNAFQNTKANGLLSVLAQIENASKGLDSSKLTDYSTSLRNLSTAVREFAGIEKKVTPAIASLKKLADVDLSKLKLDGDFSGFSGFAKNADSLAEAVKKLSSVQPKELNKTIKYLQKLGTADLGGLTNNLRSLNGIDLSSLERIGTSFKDLALSLSGADKVPTSTRNIFQSLSQLAASSGSVSLVTAALPALTVETTRFISAMSAAPSVKEGTATVVSALSGLASAGTKAEKTAAALPELTKGVTGFVTALSGMPDLSDKILRAVESLAKLSAAGGKAGAVSVNLQRQITGLSVSMSGLQIGAGKAVKGLKSFAGQLLSMVGLAGGLYSLTRAMKTSIEVASGLSEAQNVVVQGFGPLIKKIEDFGKTSIQNFGMSELAAKNTAGIYAVMAKSLGLLPDASTDMSIALTGLTGDLASFYNISQDVASTALKSIFTGETESLKRFGIVLTQSNLEAYALSQGITKTVKSMTQAELVTLRFNYVMDAASSSMGDFARTSGGSWANQVRILSQQFQQLAGIVGSGLITAFLPVIKVINAVMSKIIQLATVVSSFLGKFFGIKKAVTGSGAGFADLADSAEAVADNTEAAAGGISDVGGAAAKSEKQMNKFIAGWQEVNSMSSENEGSGSGSGGAGGGGEIALPEMEMPSDYSFTVSVNDQASPILEAIRTRFKELCQLFAQGFKFGFGDMSVFSSIQENLKSIGESFRNIFTNGQVVSAFNSMIDTLTYNAGVKVGAFTSIGSTILDNITGGAALYLDRAKERIAGYLVSMFNITAETDTIVSNFLAAVADIFTVFRSPEAKQITSDLIQIFADGFMGASLLGAKFVRDITSLVLNPITENAGKIKTAIQNTLGPISTVMNTLANSFTHLWTTVHGTYDQHIKPMLDSFKEGISQIVGHLLDGYNSHISPVLDRLAEKFSNVWKGTITPLLDNFIELFGDVADLIKTVWQNVLQPAIDWVAQKIMPAVAPVIEAMGKLFIDTFKEIGERLNGFVTAARGVVQFLTGIFSADWEKAWNGIKKLFKGIWDAIPSAITAPIEKAGNALTSFLSNTLYSKWQSAWNSIKSAFHTVWEALPDFITNPITDACDSLISFLSDNFSSNWDSIWSTARDALHTAWDSLPESIKTPITEACEGLISFLNDTFSGNWNGAWETLKTGFSTVWNALPDIVKEPVRSIIGFINTMINSVESGINGVIRALNSINIHIPDTPFTKGLSIGFDLSTVNLPNIPQLSRGGILKKGQWGFLEGNGAEAVVPLENTAWMGVVADQLSEKLNFGGYRVAFDASLPNMDYRPAISQEDFGQLRQNLQMEFDAKQAQQNFEMRELKNSVDQCYQALGQLLKQGIVLDNNEFTKRFKNSATDFRRRTGSQLGVSF